MGAIEIVMWSLLVRGKTIYIYVQQKPAAEAQVVSTCIYKIEQVHNEQYAILKHCCPLIEICHGSIHIDILTCHTDIQIFFPVIIKILWVYHKQGHNLITKHSGSDILATAMNKVNNTTIVTTYKITDLTVDGLMICYTYPMAVYSPFCTITHH